MALSANQRQYFQIIGTYARYFRHELLPLSPKEEEELLGELIVCAGNHFKIDYDPHRRQEFLKNLAVAIDQLLAGQTDLEAAALPINLKEIVANYEQHLADLEKVQLPRHFHQPSETREFYQRFVKSTQDQLAARVPALEQNPDLGQWVARDVFEKISELVPPYRLEKQLSPRETQEAVQSALNQVFETTGLEKPPAEDVRQIAHQAHTTVQKLAVAERHFPPLKEPIPEKYTPSPQEIKLMEAQKEIRKQVGAELPKIGGLSHFPTVAKKISQDARDIIEEHLAALDRKELSDKDYQKLVKEISAGIKESYESRGEIYNETEVEKLINRVARSPAGVRVSSAPSPLPSRVWAQMAEPQGPVSWPNRLGLVPRYILGIVVSPAKAFVGAAVTNFPPEDEETREIWRLMVEEGVFEKDLETTIADLQKQGLSPDDPTIKAFQRVRMKMASIQQVNQPVVGVLKTHYYARGRAGALPPYPWIRGAGAPLVRRADESPPTSPRGQARLRLGRRRIASRLWRKYRRSPGRTILQFRPTRALARFLSSGRFSTFRGLFGFVYRRTLGRGLGFLATKLGLGKLFTGALKTGLGLLAKLGVKLGLDLGIAGVSAAAAPFTAGISALVGFALTALGKLWGKIKKILPSWAKINLKKLFARPERAAAALAAVLALGAMATAAGLGVGIPLIAAGAGGLAVLGLANAGPLLTGLSAKGVGLVTLFMISPFRDLVALFVILGLGVASVLTFFIVITTTGAFITPSEPIGLGAPAPTFGKAVSPRDPDEVAGLPLAEQLIFVLQQCGITHVNSQTLSATQECIANSDLPNKDKIMAQVSYSVNEVGPGLQCVGFVRAVMASLGIDLEGGRHARGYLDPPPPNGFTVYSDMNLASVGDIVIMGGTTYGHMGVVIGKEGNLIKVAQAWGTHNGWVQVTEVNPIYFDGFLRPQ